MELAQHGERSLAVQLPDVPVVMLEDEFVVKKMLSGKSPWMTSASLVSCSIGSVPKERKDFAASP
jgi:hypothetical protein